MSLLPGVLCAAHDGEHCPQLRRDTLTGNAAGSDKIGYIRICTHKRLGHEPNYHMGLTPSFLSILY